jgi:hypothetical protein
MDQEQRQEVFRLLPWAAFYQVLHSVCTTAILEGPPATGSYSEAIRFAWACLTGSTSTEFGTRGKPRGSAFRPTLPSSFGTCTKARGRLFRARL